MSHTPFEIALERREREVDLLWTRSNTYWVIISLCFTAYWTVADSPLRSLFVSCIGLITSISWAFTISGTKWWQDYWERKMELTASVSEKPLLDEAESPKTEFWLFEPKRFSVSKVLMTIASFFIVSWGILVLRAIPPAYGKTFSFQGDKLVKPSLLVLSLVVFVALLFFAKGKKK